ncbi:MAG: hypothetical protein K0R63_607 [Rickettsiales bacterium]|jgi:hypothetical protein|nr:hypothetical protein [Rickettsiales bacterium]
MNKSGVISDPIQVAKNREKMRSAKHRVDGAKNIEGYVTRISLPIEDKQRLFGLLQIIRDEASRDYDAALKMESRLLNRPESASTTTTTSTTPAAA